MTIGTLSLPTGIAFPTPTDVFMLKPNLLLHLSSLDYYQYSSGKIRLPVETRIQLKKCFRCKLKVRDEVPQNANFPRQYARKEKKPFSTPINGLLVKSLIPTAYNVYNARITLINNLKKLLKVVPVHAYTHINNASFPLVCCLKSFMVSMLPEPRIGNSLMWCSEIHVGPVGHPFTSCKGAQANLRKGLHEWMKAHVEDMIIPIEAYHLEDRLGKRIPHEERFSIPRIPAMVELCIQAGQNRSEVVAPSSNEEIVALAEETLQAWERMRKGAKRLMRMYPVRVCGYCPEIHVGPQGHKAQSGAHKHQQRNGQHGWQSTILDDLIPPRFVWHVPDVNGPPLERELKDFYGKAPAVVELCIQAGADLPEQYKSTMQLDVGIPSTMKEDEMVV
ncbi:hypothetical protein AAHE18_13G132000 [Arachis hypogaea]